MTQHRDRSSWTVPAAIAALAVIVAVVWGAVAAWSSWRDVEDFPRADIPGQLEVDVAEPGERVVYYERREWFATVPVDVDLEVEVSGPDGQPVETEPHSGTVNYRMLRRVGQAHATFDAAQPGTYDVAVSGPAAGDDETFAVGRSITASLLRDLVPPAVILVVGLAAAAAIALTTNRGRPAAARRGDDDHGTPASARSSEASVPSHRR